MSQALKHPTVEGGRKGKFSSFFPAHGQTCVSLAPAPGKSRKHAATGDVRVWGTQEDL